MQVRNSPIHTWQKLFLSLHGQPNCQMGKTKLSLSFMQPNIWAFFDEISLNLIYSFEWVAPSWGNQNTEWKQIFNVKCENAKLKPQKYIGFCEKPMGFSPKMVTKGHNFCKVRIGL